MNEFEPLISNFFENLLRTNFYSFIYNDLIKFIFDIFDLNFKKQNNYIGHDKHNYNSVIKLNNNPNQTQLHQDNEIDTIDITKHKISSINDEFNNDIKISFHICNQINKTEIFNNKHNESFINPDHDMEIDKIVIGSTIINDNNDYINKNGQIINDDYIQNGNQDYEEQYWYFKYYLQQKNLQSKQYCEKQALKFLEEINEDIDFQTKQPMFFHITYNINCTEKNVKRYNLPIIQIYIENFYFACRLIKGSKILQIFLKLCQVQYGTAFKPEEIQQLKEIALKETSTVKLRIQFDPFEVKREIEFMLKYNMRGMIIHGALQTRVSNKFSQVQNISMSQIQEGVNKDFMMWNQFNKFRLVQWLRLAMLMFPILNEVVGMVEKFSDICMNESEYFVNEQLPSRNVKPEHRHQLGQSREYI